MRLAGFAITAAVVAGLSGPAFAQEGSGQPIATNPPTPVNQAVASTSSDNLRSWMVSGFIGTNFGSSRNTNRVELDALENIDSGTTSANFGGQVAYLGRGVIGGEFLADFSPRLNTFNNVLFENAPNVNSYMFNLIAVAPFGHAHSYDPYLSGGIGVVTLNSTIFTVDPTLAPNISAIGTETVSGSRFGWDLGGGVMAWSEKNWGFRGDVRYYRTGSNNTDVLDLNNIGDGSVFSRVELSGISFWKANAGLAFRW
jgi:Outer membrane protein beta-barrel domain